MLHFCVALNVLAASFFGKTPHEKKTAIAFFPSTNVSSGDQNKSSTDASPLETYARDPNAFFLDVRTEGEVRFPPFLDQRFLNIPVTLADLPQPHFGKSHFLREWSESGRIQNSTELPRNKMTPIVVYSSLSGLRAQAGVRALESLGYKKVLNGGGIRDVIAACQQKKSFRMKMMNFFAQFSTPFEKEHPFASLDE